MTVGIDIVDIRRIERLVSRYSHRFLNKVFTEAEQNYCENSADSMASYAGRFASKEAIRKALQPLTPEQYLPFLEMEILPDDNGVPIPAINQNSGVQDIFSNISLSISHEKHYAVACAIAEEK